MPITSRANPQIKQVKRLLRRREREDTGLCFVEGLQLVSEAVAMGFEVETLVVAEELLDDGARRFLAAHRGLPRLEVTEEVLSSISPSDGHQGLAAVVRQRWAALDQIRLGEELGWVALDRVGHPGSLGTILRVSDAVGGRGVFLIGDSSDPYDPVAMRASLGAVFSQQLVRTSWEEFVAWKRAQRALVVGTSPTAAADYRETRYPRPVVLLMGSRRGLSGEARSVCDMMVRIPMVGRTDSHHVAVATAIILYEALTQARPPSQPIS